MRSLVALLLAFAMLHLSVAGAGASCAPAGNAGHVATDGGHGGRHAGMAATHAGAARADAECAKCHAPEREHCCDAGAGCVVTALVREAPLLAARIAPPAALPVPAVARHAWRAPAPDTPPPRG